MTNQLLTRRLLLPVLAVVLATGIATVMATTAQGNTTSVSSQIDSSTDDAMSTVPNFGGFNTTSEEIFAGYIFFNPGDEPTVGGWRFNNLALPACATITEAYAELASSYFGDANDPNTNTTTALALEDTAAPATFSAGSTPADRWPNRTTFETSWDTFPSTFPDVTWFQTPSLVDGVQELVDSYGDVDSIVMLENGEGNAAGVFHGWLTYDKLTEQGAKLYISYECEEPTPTPTPTSTPSPTPTPTPTVTPSPTPTPTPTVTPTPPAGGEGCTPGYWKQKQHFDSWVDFEPGDSFDDVFGVDSSFDGTLLQALKRGGGGENAHGRHAVAALLNAATGGVDSSFSVDEVIQAVQDAYDSGDFEGQKNIFADDNESGCPLN